VHTYSYSASLTEQGIAQSHYANETMPLLPSSTFVVINSVLLSKIFYAQNHSTALANPCGFNTPTYLFLGPYMLHNLHPRCNTLQSPSFATEKHAAAQISMRRATKNASRREIVTDHFCVLGDLSCAVVFIPCNSLATLASCRLALLIR
jgi:hypothetical protein